MAYGTSYFDAEKMRQEGLPEELISHYSNLPWSEDCPTLERVLSRERDRTGTEPSFTWFACFDKLRVMRWNDADDRPGDVVSAHTHQDGSSMEVYRGNDAEQLGEHLDAEAVAIVMAQLAGPPASDPGAGCPTDAEAQEWAEPEFTLDFSQCVGDGYLITWWKDTASGATLNDVVVLVHAEEGEGLMDIWQGSNFDPEELNSRGLPAEVVKALTGPS